MNKRFPILVLISLLLILLSGCSDHAPQEAQETGGTPESRETQGTHRKHLTNPDKLST